MPMSFTEKQTRIQNVLTDLQSPMDALHATLQNCQILKIDFISRFVKCVYKNAKYCIALQTYYNTLLVKLDVFCVNKV